jgi:hypothetical protein
MAEACDSSTSLVALWEKVCASVECFADRARLYYVYRLAWLPNHSPALYPPLYFITFQSRMCTVFNSSFYVLVGENDPEFQHGQISLNICLILFDKMLSHLRRIMLFHCVYLAIFIVALV